MNPSTLCKRCDHELSRHCKSNQSHGCHKDESRMIPLKYQKKPHICQTRHCLNPICSCVDFIEPDPPAEIPEAA